MNARSFAHLVVCAGGAMLFAACITRVPASTWVYEPNPPRPEVAKHDLRIVVTPFDDMRRQQRINPVAAPYDTRQYYDIENVLEHWAQQKPERYSVDGMDNFARMSARWLAQELDASGQFASARFSIWKELADSAETPDLIVTGTLYDSRKDSQVLEIRALNPSPVQILWSKAYNLRLLRVVDQIVLGLLGSIITGPNMRPVFLTIRDDIAEALKPGGAIASGIRKGS
ncbi:MAG: hypothetical protein HY922_10855 [Elusimicrobia bacterium]|nr:hypothetical protein [Elusimicrobiota bacterium]